MTPNAPFERPVAPSERLYLVGLDVVPPACLHVVVEGDGALSEDALRQAVATAARANPGCRLALRGAGRRLRWVAQPQPPPVRTRAEPLDPNDLQASAWLRERIDPRFGATCSVTLLPGPWVVFRAFHGVMDGMGVLAWMREVFGALRGDAVQGHTARHTDTEVAGLDGPRPEREALRPNAPCALVPRGVDATRSAWTRRRLDGVHRLRVPALAIALASLHRAHGHADPLRIMVPVDLRPRLKRHRPKLRSTGNLSLPIFLDVAPDATVASVTAQMLASLAGGYERAVDPGEVWLERLPRFGVSAFMRAFIWVCSRRGRFPATAILSHLGRLELEEFSTPDYSASTVWVLPVHAGVVPLSLTLVEHPTHVELTCCAPADPAARPLTVALLDAVERAARDALSRGPARAPRTTEPGERVKPAEPVRPSEPVGSGDLESASVPVGAGDLESEIKRMVALVSHEPDLEEVEADMNLFELGIIDSFGFVTLIAALESKYHVGIQEEDYSTGAFFTLGGIVEWIGSREETL